MDYKNSFVLYESVFVQYHPLMRRGKTFEAAAFIEAVMKYGLYGEVPDDDDEIWDYGFDGVVATISTAKERYTKRINIPEDELAQFLEEGMTLKEIAKIYNCSDDTVSRRMKQFGLSKKTAKPQRTAEKPQTNRTHFNEKDNFNGKEEEKEDGKANSCQHQVSF
jgi:transposase-like protein